MGFFSDLFEGNFGNLGHDIFADPVAETGLLAGGALLTGGLLAPELLAAGSGLFGAGAADAGLTGGALAGAETAGTAGAAGTDLTALLSGAAAGGGEAGGLTTAGDAALPTNATLTSGTGLSVPGATPSPTGGTNLASQLVGGADAATPAGDVTAGVPGGGSQSLFDKLLTGAENSVAKNPIGIAAATGGLAADLLKKPTMGPAQTALAGEAPVLQKQGNELQGYLQSGTLPPALQAQLDQQIQAAKARIIANHAAQGRPTDPSQNSALAQELNAVDLQATALKGQTEVSLFQQGAQDIEMSNQLLTTLANFDRQDQQAVMQAIANFAKAFSPSNTISLNLGGAKPAPA